MTSRQSTYALFWTSRGSQERDTLNSEKSRHMAGKVDGNKATWESTQKTWVTQTVRDGRDRGLGCVTSDLQGSSIVRSISTLSEVNKRQGDPSDRKQGL